MIGSAAAQMASSGQTQDRVRTSNSYRFDARRLLPTAIVPASIGRYVDTPMMQDAAPLVDEFQRDGFIVVRGLLPRPDVLQLRSHAESLVSSDDPEQPARRYVQTAFNAQGAVKLVKASGLAEHDRLFNAVATCDGLVDVVETLLGPGARRFRDVLVVKPARTGGALSYHQDSAYWDVEPKALVSCWIGLGDVSEQGSCLSIVPGTHRREIEHGLFLRGRYEVPRPITRTLRRLVSLAGTGDNPTGAGGSALAWRAKRWILAETTPRAEIERMAAAVRDILSKPI